MRTAQAAYSTARFIAMLGSVVVWLFGTVACLYFLAWFVSSPEGDPNPPLSATAVLAVAVIALADLVLCIIAARPVGLAVLRVTIIAVLVLAILGLLVSTPDTTGAVPIAFVLLSFLVPALAYALVLPVAILSGRDLRAAATSMAGITVAFLAAFLVQSASDAKLWISFADLGGAFATGVLAALLLGARAAKERASTSPEQALTTTPSGTGPTAG